MTLAMGFRCYDLVQQLRSAIDVECDSLSQGDIANISALLRETLSLLHGVSNSRKGICGLPVEILTQIINGIPEHPGWNEEALEPFWYHPFRDSSLLLPISQTCRRLRMVALSSSTRWRYITSRLDGVIPTLLERSKDSPLEVTLSGAMGSTNLLRAFYASMTPRLRGLHFITLDYSRLKAFNSFLDLVHPELESLTCCGADPTSPIWQRRRLLLSQDNFPRLTQLVLEGVVFRNAGVHSSLTHLVLSRMSNPGLLKRVATLLSHCPRLEDLVLSRLFDSAETLPILQESPAFPYMRRVVLHDLVSKSLRFFLNLLVHCSHETALCILNETASFGTFAFPAVLPERMPDARAAVLGIGAYPSPFSIHASSGMGDRSRLFSVTAAGPMGALRMASAVELIGMSQYATPNVWIQRILSEHTGLANVQEVWLVCERSAQDTPMDFGRELCPVLTALPSLQTVVLVLVAIEGEGADEDGQYEGSVLEPPSLSCLPSVDRAVDVSSLKTLRLVLCAGPNARSELRIQVDLSRILDELASGGYCYLERLVLQVTPRVDVEEADVRRIQEYFVTVNVERIREAPRMPLPQSCVEADERPGGGRIWTEPLC